LINFFIVLEQFLFVKKKLLAGFFKGILVSFAIVHYATVDAMISNEMPE